LIGNVGDGAKIAFNILNVGRFKLGAAAVGGCKLAVHEAVRYANERHQFNKPISSFGAIKYKLAEMAIRTWVAESITYRTVGMIDALIGDGAEAEKKLRSIEEYAVECSINKVACSETLDYVVDEMVQVFGGYGYSADYPAEKFYRDARINRIFEGTNEINRMLIPGLLLKRAAKGELGLLRAAQSVQHEITNLPDVAAGECEDVLANEAQLVANAKKIALLILGTAAQKFGDSLANQQEILMSAADIIMNAYQMESACLRARKIAEKGNAENQIAMAQVFCGDALHRIETTAKVSLAAMCEGDDLQTYFAALKRLSKNVAPINTLAARRHIADALIGANKYIF
jgi:alkylation response protein AidB-like acyl-CoA dehydrogenase